MFLSNLTKKDISFPSLKCSFAQSKHKNTLLLIETYLKSLAEHKIEYDYIKVDIKNEDGDIIGTDIFTCIGFVNTSSKIEPEWGPEFINDNELIWQKIEYDFEVENKWQPETVYIIGDMISNDSGIYRCANYRAKSGADIPTLEDLDNGLIKDGNIIWTIMDASHRMIDLGWNEHIKLNKVITIAGS